MKQRKNIAGMSIGGGQKENFFFCLLEHFPDSGRWFLSSLHQVKEEESMDSDEAITAWVEKYELEDLIVDFPMSKPTCETCELVCPGTKNCHHPDVVAVRDMMEELLDEDQRLLKANPKKYEQERIQDNLVEYTKSAMEKETSAHILSKSFKRKLKKGFIPYWNRPIDFWVWQNYYDQLLEIFNISYDSFSNVSMMLLSKYKYLRRHLPSSLNTYESQTLICLLELYRQKIIGRKHISQMQDIQEAVLGRLEIIREVEKKLNVFIYEKDLEIIVKHPKAFDSFLLALVGKSFLDKKIRNLPEWSLPKECRFLVPSF